jgi:DNA polymerase (family 10)
MSEPVKNYSNSELAKIFTRIADLLEIKGEVIYKILAYRKASDSLNDLGRPALEFWRENKLTEIPGVGKAIAEKIDEIYLTGKVAFLERLEEEVPPTLVDLLQVPDLGPKKVALFWKQLEVTSLKELEAAARTGKLRSLPGMGEKSEARILAGIEALSRRSHRIPLGRAWPFAQYLLQELRSVPGVKAVEAAGSLRRMRPTVGDLDLLAAASDSSAVMRAFTSLPEVERVVSQGEIKASVEFRGDEGPRPLWVHPPERFGTALQYATGSKDHNVRLRELAQKRGLSLSDQAFLRPDGSEILCASEEEVYAQLDLPWIAPELREDRGEVQAALESRLPKLIELADIRSELHSHSTWSDGRLSIRQMAEAAIRRGLKILAITDHSASLGVAGGLSVDEIREQRLEIQAVQSELGDTIRLLQGCEVEIRADGKLDFPDEDACRIGYRYCRPAQQPAPTSPASHRANFERPAQPARRHPRSSHRAHDSRPRGRRFVDDGSSAQAAAEHGKVLEINAHPVRLDLDDVNARRCPGGHPSVDRYRCSQRATWTCSVRGSLPPGVPGSSLIR